MRRVIAASVPGNRILLEKDDAHHLVRVLRMREGELFEAVSPEGLRFQCRLVRSEGDWIGSITGICRTSWESPLHLILAQALIKKDRFEWVAQKATELGVREIVPLITHRTELELGDRQADRKLRRWKRILGEAVKQCGRCTPPVLHGPASLEEVLGTHQDAALLVPDEEGGTTLRDWLTASRSKPGKCCVFVGPEGGWDEEDRKRFRAHGATLVRLGPRILRTETAAVCILSLVQYELGDLAMDPTGFRVDYEPANQ